MQRRNYYSFQVYIGRYAITKFRSNAIWSCHSKYSRNFTIQSSLYIIFFVIFFSNLLRKFCFLAFERQRKFLCHHTKYFMRDFMCVMMNCVWHIFLRNLTFLRQRVMFKSLFNTSCENDEYKCSVILAWLNLISEQIDRFINASIFNIYLPTFKY